MSRLPLLVKPAVDGFPQVADDERIGFVQCCPLSYVIDFEYFVNKDYVG